MTAGWIVRTGVGTGRDPGIGGAQGVARYIDTVGARGRLRREVRSIALDLLGPWASDELSPECAAWIGRSIDRAVSEVCESALGALVTDLDTALDGAPPEIARSLAREKVRHDAGFG